ncbi:MAG: sulfotransferase domain-containing protein [Elainella sp. Prado103]|jgi:hypothetical protein|nr:sulfotransferase domain-containing protein [Elainella sp. Prado103]
MVSLTKRLAYPVLDLGLKTWAKYNLAEYDIAKTIIVASSGRGGSTWLAEIIGTLPGYPVLWEPLHPGKNPECKQYGFNYRVYIPIGADAPLQSQYLEQLFTGAKLSTRVISALAFHPRQYFPFNGFLVKFVNANLLLYWLLNQFPLKAILMIRHPCAVVSSQLRHSAWTHVSKQNCSFPNAVAADYPHLQEVFDFAETREEILAFEWVLKTYVPLSQPKPHPWYLSTYESLVMDSYAELERIFAFLEKPIPPKAYCYLRQPSKTTQSKSNVATGRNPLTGWQDQLTARQIERILKIIHLSGIDFYTDELVPDVAKMNTFSGLDYVI